MLKIDFLNKEKMHPEYKRWLFTKRGVGKILQCQGISMIFILKKKYLVSIRYEIIHELRFEN